MNALATRRAQLTIAFAVFTLVGISMGGGGVLLPAQIADFGVDKTTIGAVFVATSLGYLGSAVLNGTLLHHLGVRAYLAGGAVILCGASTAIAFRPGLAGYLLLEGATGFGVGALEAGLNAYLSTLDRATMLLNSLHAFFGVGALIGPLIAATLLSRGYSWTMFFVLTAVLVAPLLIGLLLCYPRSAATDAVAEPPRFSAGLRHRAVWLGGLFLSLYVAVEISIGNWSFSFLTEDRGQSTLLAGWAVSGFWIGFTAGRFVLSRAAERIGLDAPGLVYACLGVTILLALAIWLVPYAAAPGLVLLGCFLGPMYPTMIAVAPRLVPPGLIATAIGFMVGLSVAGGALGPWLAGTIAQRAGAWSLFPFSAALTVLVGVVWWLIARRLQPLPGDPGVAAVPVRDPGLLVVEGERLLPPG